MGSGGVQRIDLLKGIGAISAIDRNECAVAVTVAYSTCQ